MEDRDQTIGLRLTLKERQALDEQANKAGLTLTDYVRSRLFWPSDDTTTLSTDRLLRHLIYIANRIHTATYSIADEAHSVPAERLESIHADSKKEGLDYLNTLGQWIATVESEAATATPTAEKKQA